mmetsp:Transcript_20324/g.26371  ORF Transcript_20324/g.26371 Transcript_20324/m.26371 type:complete len:663 (+) Transcript_20324:76-2064(+)
MAPEEQEPGTFMYQDSIEKLPIPDLKTTLTKYEEAVSVLLSPEELKKTKAEIERFAAEEGAQLYEELKDYDKTANSYIEEFWNASYTNFQGPLVLNVNPIFVLEDDPTPSRNNQIARASSLILSSLKFIRALRHEKLSPDMWKKTPLCMSQFRYLFGSARVPSTTSEGCDEIINSQDSNHIILIRRGQLYYFEALSSDFSISITEREIIKNIKMIIKDAETLSDAEAAASSIGVLTTEERPVWSRVRKRIESLSENNALSLDLIDKALFVLCLDNIDLNGASENAQNILHGTYEINSEGIQIGTCISRWYDKLQLIVSDNGLAGINFEHSAVDGHTVLRYASDTFTDTIVRFAQTISGPIRVNSFIEQKNTPTKHSLPDTLPRKIEFDFDDDIRKSIHFAECKVSDRILRNETRILEFTGYGKQYIVRNSMSPDAFVQIAIMSAYFNLYGEIVNTYESVQTKRFKHGRTEAGRSATAEALAFMKAYNDSTLSEKDIIDKLHVALKRHSHITREAASGHGVDRLLFALKGLYQKRNPSKPLPSFFEDKGWSTLQTTVLSTSNCGNASLRHFGFGPVSNDGFGIGYIIKDDCINLCITSRHRQTDRYVASLLEYFGRIQDMLLVVNPAISSRFLSRSQDSGYSYFYEDIDTENAPPKVGRPLQE